MVTPVATSWRDDQPFASPITRAGVSVTPIVVGARDYREERRLLRRQLKEFRPDVVHSHGYHTNVIGRGVVMTARIPFVATAHGFTGGSLKNRLYEWLDCRALSRASAAIAVSRPLADELRRRGVPADRLHTVPNGWLQSGLPLTREEARIALGVQQDARVVGWVGRMTHEKGLDVFIQSLAHTPASVQACIVGDGVEREANERLAVQLGVGDRITWAGLVNEAGRYFNAFDALCQSSRTEGIPMVILEAMSMRIPIIATAVGGVPDVLSGSEAQLVASEDTRALGLAITDTLSNRVDAEFRADAAHSRLERQFSGDTWMNDHERIYQHVIATK